MKINKDNWLDLYSYLDEIYDYKPWEKLLESNFISFIYNDIIYYASIIGNANVFKGIMIMHQDYINNYLYLLNNNMSPLQLCNYQEGYLISYISNNKIEDDERAILKKLGISFNDIGISIKKYERGYLPYNLCDDDVNLLNKILPHILTVFKYVNNSSINITNSEQMILRFYSKNDNGYKTCLVNLELPDESFYKYNLSDEQINKISNFKKRNLEFEIDINNFYPSPIGDEYENNKYRLPYMLAISDRLNRKMIDFKVYSNKEYSLDNYLDLCINRLIEIFEKDCPKTIYVRDLKAKRLLEIFNINIEIKPDLFIIDKFIEMSIKRK